MPDKWLHGKGKKVEYFSKIDEIFPCSPDCPNRPSSKIHALKYGL